MARFLDRPGLFALKGQARVERLAEGESARIDAAVEAASNEAASHLLGRYGDRLPETPTETPTVLARNVAELALYHLAGSHELVGDELTQRYDRAVRWLQTVRRGAADLDLPDKPAEDLSQPQVLTTKPSSSAVFARGGLDEW